MDRKFELKEVGLHFANKSVKLTKIVQQEVLAVPKLIEGDVVAEMNSFIKGFNENKGVNKMLYLINQLPKIKSWAMQANNRGLWRAVDEISKYQKYSKDDYIDEFYYSKFF